MVDLDWDPESSTTVLILNEAILKTEEYERLLHWRFGHANSKLLQAMGLIEKSHLNEDCYCCNKAKFKRAPFPKNEGSFVAIAEPFWRIYCDGYGGQRSLGSKSYGGAKGGIVFVCPISGSIIVKLYATMKEFPAILYQVLQQIESQGFVCREVLVDTFVVNLSEAAEEVAAMFKARIIPISAGTPQELAYAERAVRSIGEKSRAMLLGAPHLPNSMWGLADIHAGNVIDVLPQVERGNKSPYEFRHGKQPNVEHLYLKVFGCPCQYSPMEGPEHKRASKTEWGYYVGMQWPMCMVYNKDEKKVVSVSRKKIICHEGMYAYFDPSQAEVPRALFTEIDPTQPISMTNDPEDVEEQNKDIDKQPEGVHSIKVLRQSQMNMSMNEALPRPPEEMRADSASQPRNQGENVPEQESLLDEDSLLETLNQHKQFAKEELRTVYQQIVEALRNIRLGKLNKEEHNKEQQISTYGPDYKTSEELKARRSQRDTKRKAEIKVGDEVKVKTARFGKQYAKGRPEYTKGKVIFLKGKKARVRYEGGHELYDTYLSHLLKVEDEDNAEDGNVVATVNYKGKWYKKSQTFYTIMATLEVGCALKRSEDNEEASWPKYFFEALIRKDWREWVMAVQKENESWRTFDAAEEVNYVDMERGASVIPLGELYTIKRTGQHKFRQYAMGNLLKAGKDYGDTFSSTVSGDGLRWFCALAAACNKRIRGWDATTGYLQTKQRIKVYAYLPSHHGFSDMEFEELAVFRQQLLKIK